MAILPFKFPSLWAYECFCWQDKTSSHNNGRAYVNRAQDVVSSMFAKGSAIGQDAVNKAKTFYEKHWLRS